MKHYLLSFFLAASLNSTELQNAPNSLQKVADYTNSNSILEEDIPPSDMPLIDLYETNQEFILETKQIQIPDHPFAFNPSIIRWNGSLLLSFRSYDPKTRATNPIGLIRLDDNFDPIGTAQIFEFPFHNPVLMSKQQDPRLIEVDNRLFLLYNNIKEDVTHREMRRMFIVELFEENGQFTASNPECIVHFEGENEMRYEKNWVPFEYEGQLLLAYSIIPHRILQPILGTNSCRSVCSTKLPFKWDWGVPRGGTQALRDGNHYMGFFHSWTDVPTRQSNGKKLTHYVMGAYLFEAKPPFSLIAVSPEPIVSENFYSPPYYKTWKPLRCIFPAGLLIDEDYVWVTYGRQDNEVWVIKMDKHKLMQSLIPISKA